MIKLKQILLELSDNSTLYHYSNMKMNVGDIVNPHMTKEGKHWLQGKKMEVALERYRKEHYPDKPSRFTCIFSSPIPQTRFIEKGILYTIKPKGKMFMTFHRLIDDLERKFNDDMFRQYSYDSLELEKVTDNEAYYLLDTFTANRYWKGLIGYNFTIKNRYKDIEVLSDGAVVTEVLGEKDYIFKSGDIAIVTDDKKIYADVSMFPKGDYDEEFIEKLKSLFDYNEIKRENAYGNKKRFQMSGYLKKGTKIQLRMPYNTLERNSNDDEHVKGRYVSTYFDLFYDGKLLKSNEERTGYSASAHQYPKEQSINFTQYLKKIK